MLGNFLSSLSSIIIVSLMAYLCELHGSVDHKTWHLTNMGFPIEY